LAVFEGGLGGFFLEGGVGLDLLLDEVAQFQDGSLKDLQALLELRSQNLLLGQALGL
jgi:hypothetical protein